MAMASNAQEVFVLSATGKAADYFSGLLPRERFTVTASATSAVMARATLNQQTPAIAIVNAPLPDENGIALARELTLAGWGVLLLAPASAAAATLERLSQDGVLVLPRPADRTLLLQSMYLLSAARARFQRLEKQTATLQTKIDDIRLVDRAKLLLVQQLKMTENEAHRYIEKTAMDRSESKRAVAQTIIRTYED